MRTRWSIGASDAARTYGLLKEKKKDMEKKEKAYGIIRDLDNMASGNNAKKLVFEQYVLAGYFEDILEAANLRLRRMTAADMSCPEWKRRVTAAQGQPGNPGDGLLYRKVPLSEDPFRRREL